MRNIKASSLLMSVMPNLRHASELREFAKNKIENPVFERRGVAWPSCLAAVFSKDS